MLKRMLPLLLVAAMALTPGAYAQEPAQPVSLLFWHSMSDEAGVLVDKFVTQFNATIGKDRQISVEAVFQGQYSDATTKLNRDITLFPYTADLLHIFRLSCKGSI